jgi:hypothetical protein
MISIYHIYCYRNICKLKKNYIDTYDAVKCIKRITHTASKGYFQEVLNELCIHGFLEKLSRENYRVITNYKNELMLKRAKEYNFPLI